MIYLLGAPHEVGEPVERVEAEEGEREHDPRDVVQVHGHLDSREVHVTEAALLLHRQADVAVHVDNRL